MKNQEGADGGGGTTTTSTLRIIFIFCCCSCGLFIFFFGTSVIPPSSISSTISPFLDLPSSKETKQQSIILRPPRFVTIVDAGNEVNSQGRLERIKAIYETWGPEANALYVLSNSSENPTMEREAYSYLLNVTSNNGNSYRNENQQQDRAIITQRNILVLPKDIPERSFKSLQYIIRHLVAHHHSIEYVLLTNGHTYVLVENLCAFLSTKDPNHHVYSGHPLKRDEKVTAFNPTSAGFILSMTSMKHLVNMWDRYEEDNNDPIASLCFKEPDNAGRSISNCLAWTTGNDETATLAEDTRDSLGRQRFHSFPLTRLVTGDINDWYDDLSRDPTQYGKRCCANDTISFHYVDHDETRAFYKIRQTLLKEMSNVTTMQQRALSASPVEADNINTIANDDEGLKSYLMENYSKKVIGHSRTMDFLTRWTNKQQQQKLQQANSNGEQKLRIVDDDPWEAFIDVCRRISTPPSNPVCTKEQLLVSANALWR